MGVSIQSFYADFETLSTRVEGLWIEGQKERNQRHRYGASRRKNSIPYRRTSNRDGLLWYLLRARDLSQEIQELYRNGLSGSPEFERKLMEFYRCEGVLFGAQFVEVDDLAPANAGREGGKAVSRDPQRRWVSTILLSLMDGMQRHLAEIELAHSIRIMRERGDPNEKFLGKIVGKSGLLKKTYQSERLPDDKLREWAERTDLDIPPLNIPRRKRQT